jgi:hypothetical protein
MRSEIDHLVVACATLEQGAAWAADLLGVQPQDGGKHATMGTHNRLLRLGEHVYLELIAIDPEGVVPARPRWFGLDLPAVQARAAERPFLLTWVAATDDIHEAVTRVPALGEVAAFTRNSYAWQFALPQDGRLNFDGVLPSVIQWNSDHPAAQLEDRGCRLLALELVHPQAQRVLPLFRALKLTGPVNLATGELSLTARVLTPRGPVDLR